MSIRAFGLPADRMTCVGHSLGAHICGLISKYVLFRIHRIIALDPARPLILPSSRLDDGHAAAVHVLHTNAGHYGEGGKSGHVDFCINGGKIQPFCEHSGRKHILILKKNLQGRFNRRQSAKQGPPLVANSVTISIGKSHFLDITTCVADDCFKTSHQQKTVTS